MDSGKENEILDKIKEIFSNANEVDSNFFIKFNDFYYKLIKNNDVILNNLFGHKKKDNKETFKFIKMESIICNKYDEYRLSPDEFIKIYSFYLHNAFDSRLKRITYSHTVRRSIKRKINGILDFSKESHKVLFVSENTKENMEKFELAYDTNNFDLERVVGVNGIFGSDYLEKTLHSIRNCLAHKNFIFKYNSKSEKMVIFEDHDQYNFKFRMIVKLDTLLSIIEIYRRCVSNEADKGETLNERELVHN